MEILPSPSNNFRRFAHKYFQFVKTSPSAYKSMITLRFPYLEDWFLLYMQNNQTN